MSQLLSGASSICLLKGCQRGAAHAENERLRAALKFYRDEWLVTVGDKEPYEPTDTLWDDKGSRARAALQSRSE